MKNVKRILFVFVFLTLVSGCDLFNQTSEEKYISGYLVNILNSSSIECAHLNEKTEFITQSFNVFSKSKIDSFLFSINKIGAGKSNITLKIYNERSTVVHSQDYIIIHPLTREEYYSVGNSNEIVEFRISPALFLENKGLINISCNDCKFTGGGEIHDEAIEEIDSHSVCFKYDTNDAYEIGDSYFYNHRENDFSKIDFLFAIKGERS